MAAKTAILSVRILGDSKGARQAMGETEKAGSRLGGMMGKIGGAVAAGAAVAVGGLAALGTAGVKAAGDLEQSVGAVDAVFKDQATAMHEYADQAATALGLTKNEYNELATVMGTQLKNGGTAMDELGGKTHELMTLGADLASMFGGTTADAVGALSSALKGERDPIEAYGVSLNQAAIDAKAAELGFQKVGGALSAEANQAATLALIMDQTADAHGNFGKETGTFAGQVSILTAQWGNFVATLGTALLPLLTTVLTFITSTVMPGLQDFAEVAGPVISSALDQLGPALQALMPSLSGLVSAGTPVTSLFEALTPHLGTLGEAFASVLPVIADFATGIMPLISQAFATLVPIVVQLASAALPLILEIFTQLAPIVLQIASTVLPVVLEAFSALVPVVMQLVSAVLPPLLAFLPVVGAAFLSVVQAVAPLIPLIAESLVPVIQIIAPLLVTVVEVLTSILGPALQIVAGIIQTVAGILTGDWASAWEGAKAVVAGAIGLVTAIVTGGITLIKSVIMTGLALVVNLFTTTWSRITSGASSAATGLSTAIGNGVDDAIRFVTGLPERILSSLGNLGRLLLRSGTSLMEGFTQGIRNGISKAINAAKDAVQSVRDFFPFSPAKRGPLSGRGYTSYSGRALVVDFAKAMTSQMPVASRAASRVAAASTIEGGYDLLAAPPSGRMPTTAQRIVHLTVNFNSVVTDRLGVAREIRRILAEYDSLVVT